MSLPDGWEAARDAPAVVVGSITALSGRFMDEWLPDREIPYVDDAIARQVRATYGVWL